MLRIERLTSAVFVRTRVVMTALIAAMIVAACGGGGGGSGGPAVQVTIGAQPTDQSVVEGASATFVVVADGAVAFQWQTLQGADWVDIPGATFAGYTLASAQQGDNGRRFRSIVSSTVDTSVRIASASAGLTVTAAAVAPSVLQQPADLGLIAGGSGSIWVTAAGTSPAYQWQRAAPGGGYADVAGAIGPMLALGPVDVSDDGSRYRVVVSNVAGSVVSQEVRLSVAATPHAPVFTLEPQGVLAVAGGSAAFSVAVAGLPTPTLVWQRSSTEKGPWSDMAGQTTPTLFLPQVAVNDTNSHFRVVASNSGGSVASGVAMLFVSPAPGYPQITTQPVDRSVGAGATPTFSVAASATNISYQWLVSVDGGNTFAAINGAVQADYRLPIVGAVDDGKRFRVRVSNGIDSILSAVATLHVATGPQITLQPQNQAWHPGQEAPLFTVAANGTNLSYQWQVSVDGSTYADVSGATGASYVHAGGASDQTTRVRVVVGNGTGSTTSDAALLSALRWSFVNPRPTGGVLLALSWVDANTVVAVGESSDILRSADAGMTWQIVSEGEWSDRELFGVAFNGAQTGVAVGRGGFVRRSIDGGQHWVTARGKGSFGTVAGTDLRAVAFDGAANVTAVGDLGVIFRSADAGATWSQAVNGSNRYAITLRAVAFRGGVGLAVGDSGEVLRSIDGGAHWAPVTSGTAKSLASVSFASDSVAVAVGESGVVLRSADAGASWSTVSAPSSAWLASVHFGSALVGVVVDTQGAGMRTTDGGLTWTPLGGVLSDRWIYAVQFGSAGTALAVGSAGAMVRSVDGGASWTSADAGSSPSLMGLAFADSSVGAAVGLGGTILRTNDAGASWTPVTSATMQQQLQAVAFADASTGVAVGVNGAIVRSTDAGVHWSSVTSPTNAALLGVAFASPTVGVAVSGYGGMIRTTDGGASWIPVAGAAFDLSSIAFNANGVGVAVGQGGLILRSTDGGQTWQQVLAGTSQGRLNSVAFSDANTLMAVGWYGAALRSTDAGLTWTSIGLPYSDYVYYGIAFGSSTLGAAVGNLSTVHVTRDGGLTWGNDISQRSPTLNAVAFPDPHTAVAIGAIGFSGVIMRARY